jgi:hypothetical protein
MISAKEANYGYVMEVTRIGTILIFVLTPETVEKP